MGAAPSTPRGDAEPKQKAEYLLGTFVGQKPQDLRSQFWQKLLALPLDFYWPESTVKDACQSLAQNNCHTRHLAKLLIHLIWSLQEAAAAAPGAWAVYSRAINAARFSSVFLKYLIENSKGDNFEEPLFLNLIDNDVKGDGFPQVDRIKEFVIQGLLGFIGTSDVTPSTYLLHLEVVNLLLVAMSTQLHSGPSPGPKDVHPFIDAAMVQESALVGPFVRRLLISYITRVPAPLSAAYHLSISKVSQPGVLRKVGSAAVSEWMLELLPTAVEKGVCIVTNMGAMDVLGAQEEVLRVAKRFSLPITVAVAYETFETHTGSGTVIPSSKFTQGVYELGWNWNNWKELAQGTLAGHLLECGCQVTGGYYMHPADQHREFSFQQLLDVSLPFANIRFDGEVYLAKAENSGGEISFRTCAQQLLYELGDPSAYITPDVVVNFQNVSFLPLSKDMVFAKGAEPSLQKRPETLLQLLPKECGWKGWGEISYGGLGCVKRASAADYLVRSWMEGKGPGTQEHIVSYIIGLDSLQAHSSDVHPLSAMEPMDLRLRMDGLFDLKDHAVHFTQEFESLYTNGPAGGGGISTGYKKEIFLQKILVPRECIFWSFNIKYSNPLETQHVIGSTELGMLPHKHTYRGDLEQLKGGAASRVYSDPLRNISMEPAPGGIRIPLYRAAHSRAGDKGNDLNFSIIPHFPADIERLKVVITPEWVTNVTKALIGPASALTILQHAQGLHFNQAKDDDEQQLVVEIYEATGVHSLNVVVRNVLDGGVNCSRRIDRHGKTTSDLILCQEIVLP